MKQDESPEVLVKAAASKPMELEAYKKAVFNLKKPHVDRKWKYDGMMTLPHDYETKVAYIDPTPREWTRISIRPAGHLFRLVSFGAGTRILAADLRLADLPADLVLDKLSLAEAIATGAKINAAYLEKFSSRKS